jgi:DNA invertase Pin-like site-specific DNA recombinase
MSTERQEYSTKNQLDVIEKYAADHDLSLVAIYEDAGKSGLTKSGRPAR